VKFTTWRPTSATPWAARSIPGQVSRLDAQLPQSARVRVQVHSGDDFPDVLRAVQREDPLDAGR